MLDTLRRPVSVALLVHHQILLPRHMQSDPAPRIPFSQGGCASWAMEYSLTVIETNNCDNNTWAWYGCDDLQFNEAICRGAVRFQEPASTALVLLTGSALIHSLKVCCDIWGQRGTTLLRCGMEPADTGAPTLQLVVLTDTSPTATQSSQFGSILRRNTL